jgi:hypothetical protein
MQCLKKKFPLSLLDVSVHQISPCCLAVHKGGVDFADSGYLGFLIGQLTPCLQLKKTTEKSSAFYNGFTSPPQVLEFFTFNKSISINNGYFQTLICRLESLPWPWLSYTSINR